MISRHHLRGATSRTAMVFKRRVVSLQKVPRRPTDDRNRLNVLKSNKKVNKDNNMEKKKVYLPKTVNLSKQNEEFYDMRRWRDGVVRYVIADVGDKCEPFVSVEESRVWHIAYDALMSPSPSR